MATNFVTDEPQQPAAPLTVALNHRCPSCQKVSIYSGILTLKDQCPHCGLNMANHDVGDGAAFGAISILGFVIVGIALALEEIAHPSFWVHGLVVLLSTAILTPLCIRFFKSYLIALKYKHHWSKGIK